MEKCLESIRSVILDHLKTLRLVDEVVDYGRSCVRFEDKSLAQLWPYHFGSWRVDDLNREDFPNQGEKRIIHRFLERYLLMEIEKTKLFSTRVALGSVSVTPNVLSPHDFGVHVGIVVRLGLHRTELQQDVWDETKTERLLF